MFGGTNAELNWCCVDVIGEDGSLNCVWVEGDAGGCLMRDMWICVTVDGVHDVMYSCGKVWNCDGRCSELNGGVSGC